MIAESHWLDRLAVRSTRREALRTVAAGAAAVALPALRPSTAQAEGPTDCRKGCLWTNRQRYRPRVEKCLTIRRAAAAKIAGAGAYPALAVVLIPAAWIDALAYSTCLDRAVLESKAGAYDCLQPNCPGFDPKAPGGPCDTCRDNCCTCQASDTGYICCVFSCGDPVHNCCPGG
jgi:hypothetical protein